LSDGAIRSIEKQLASEDGAEIQIQGTDVLIEQFLGVRLD
jgi:hypothetical protein